jgi:hypothetical protein
MFELANEITRNESNNISKCKTLVHWVHETFVWNATDYQSRSVTEILERRSGNCAEQARVLESLINSLGIISRRIAEINIQPPSIQRQQSAEAMVVQIGPSASVFGYMHNDHRWLEIQDGHSDEWIPADATLGICGVENWMKERMGFGARNEVAKDMIVPIMVVVVDGYGRVLIDRSKHYLIDNFTQYAVSKGKRPDLLSEWAQIIDTLSLSAKRAFEGKDNLFKASSLIQKAYDQYERIRTPAGFR